MSLIFSAPNTTTTSAMSDLVPETQEDPLNRVLLAGWGTSISVPQDSPPASIPAGKPVSARAARAATREARSQSRESSPRANHAGGDAPAAPASLALALTPVVEADASEVEVVDVVPGGSGAAGHATGRRLSRLNSHFKECGFASGTAVAAMFRFKGRPSPGTTRALWSFARHRPLLAMALVVISHLSGVEATSVDGGFTHSCARLNDGTIACWGSNDAGELGNTSVALGGESTTPVLVEGIATAIQVSAGWGHSCAVLTGGTVECWGSNSEGQLGSTSITQSATPVLVEGITTATSVSLGGAYSCALLTDGTIKCWGRNTENQLGNGGGQQSETPVSVQDITTATQLGAGMKHSCAVLTDGTVWCWGVNSLGELQPNTLIANSAKPVQIQNIATAKSTSGGQHHSCAVLVGGEVKCWGYNGDGRLGHTTLGDREPPTNVSGVSNAVSVFGAREFSCALLSDGTVKCWGSNAYRQLGTDSASPSPSPVTVQGLTATVESITAGNGGWHTCAALTDGNVTCWGRNHMGQLGDGSTPSATGSHHVAPVLVDFDFPPIPLPPCSCCKRSMKSMGLSVGAEDCDSEL